MVFHFCRQTRVADKHRFTHRTVNAIWEKCRVRGDGAMLHGRKDRPKDQRAGVVGRDPKHVACCGFRGVYDFPQELFEELFLFTDLVGLFFCNAGAEAITEDFTCRSLSVAWWHELPVFWTMAACGAAEQKGKSQGHKSSMMALIPFISFF